VYDATIQSTDSQEFANFIYKPQAVVEWNEPIKKNRSELIH